MDREKQLDLAEKLFKAEIKADLVPHSEAYQRGIMAGLIWKATNGTPEQAHPYKPGSAERDAFFSGFDKGLGLWDAAHK